MPFVLKTYFNYLTIDCWYLIKICTPNKTLPCRCIQKSSFLEQIIGNSPEIIHVETDIEKLYEHRAWLEWCRFT